jgi:hypothetical protein
MKNLFLICLMFILSSFAFMNDSTKIYNTINTSVSQNIIDTISIHVTEVDYSRNIDGKSYLNEKRSTDTKYTIDLKSKIVVVTHSDGSVVMFDSVTVSEKNNIYEISYYDNDIYQNVSKIYSTIRIDQNNDQVTYTEINLDFESEFNLYVFSKYDIKVD